MWLSPWCNYWLLLLTLFHQKVVLDCRICLVESSVYSYEIALNSFTLILLKPIGLLELYASICTTKGLQKLASKTDYSITYKNSHCHRQVNWFGNANILSESSRRERNDQVASESLGMWAKEMYYSVLPSFSWTPQNRMLHAHKSAHHMPEFQLCIWDCWTRIKQWHYDSAEVSCLI